MALYTQNFGYAIFKKRLDAYDNIILPVRPTKASWADRAGRVQPRLAGRTGPGEFGPG